MLKKEELRQEEKRKKCRKEAKEEGKKEEREGGWLGMSRDELGGKGEKDRMHVVTT